MSAKRQKTSHSSSSSSTSSGKQRRRKKKGSKSGRSANFKAFYHGQNEADTAKVRQKSRAIRKVMRDNEEHMVDLEEAVRERQDGGTLFQNVAKDMDKNFEDVNRNREALGDAENMTMLHDVVVAQANLSSNYRQLKSSDLLRHLHLKFHDPSAICDDEDGASSRSTACGPRTDLDWVKLGKACAALFKAPPLGGFARGAFSTGEFQAKQQKKRKR